MLGRSWFHNFSKANKYGMLLGHGLVIVDHGQIVQLLYTSCALDTP